MGIWGRERPAAKGNGKKGAGKGESVLQKENKELRKQLAQAVRERKADNPPAESEVRKLQAAVTALKAAGLDWVWPFRSSWLK